MTKIHSFHNFMIIEEMVAPQKRQIAKAIEEIKVLLIEIGIRRFLPTDLKDTYTKYPSFFDTCPKEYLYHSTFATAPVIISEILLPKVILDAIKNLLANYSTTLDADTYTLINKLDKVAKLEHNLDILRSAFFKKLSNFQNTAQLKKGFPEAHKAHLKLFRQERELVYNVNKNN